MRTDKYKTPTYSSHFLVDSFNRGNILLLIRKRNVDSKSNKSHYVNLTKVSFYSRQSSAHTPSLAITRAMGAKRRLEAIGLSPVTGARFLSPYGGVVSPFGREMHNSKQMLPAASHHVDSVSIAKGVLNRKVQP